MRVTILVSVFSIFLLFACNKEDDLFTVLPESDLVALQGMEDAYDNALMYNDSMLLCTDQPTCNDAMMMHYDEMFHQFDEMFDMHHGNYSHDNMDDDHHHEGGQNVWHGDMMNGHDNHGQDNHGQGNNGHDDNDGDGHGYEHNMETFQMMMDLREMHKQVHP